jgi:large subunit ribosomal protein L1
VAKRGKKYEKAVAQYDRQSYYSIEEAVSIVKKVAFSKVDESFDIAVNLGVDPRYPDQMVRGTVALPHGVGKTVWVLVFAKGEKVQEARDAGADHVGGPELIEKIQGGWLEFDKAVATPDMMGLVGRIGRVLGPRGLMPNPKLGTVTFDVGAAVQGLKAGRIDFRVDKAGIVHTTVGRKSFEELQLQENILSLMETLIRLKPSTSKGTYVKKVTVSSTFGPGVRVDVQSVSRAAMS